MTQPRLLAVDTAESKIREYPLLEIEVTVGSDKANGLVIRRETVSRRHAVIRRREVRFEVADLNSTNGTFVNEHRIYAPVLIKDRDEVRFGDVGFVFLDSGVPVRQAPRRPTTRLRTRLRRAVEVILILFVIGFGATEYLLNGDIISRLPRQLTNGPALISTAQPLSPSVATATTSLSPQGRAKGPPSPSKVVSPPIIEVSSARPFESAVVASPAWLARLNYYRYVSKLPTVNENDALSDGDRKHARYVMENYLSVLKEGANLAGAMHTEDSEKPWYTPEGFAAAQNSDLAEGCSRLDSSSAIDEWTAGPFHRVSVLNPDLTSVGLGSYEKGGCWTTGLDLHLGPEPKTLAHAIEFPPPDTAVSLEFCKYEWPDPLTACPGYVSPAGLPITLEVGPWVDTKLGAHSFLRGSEPIEHCAFDASSYTNPDPFAEQRGRNVLKGFGVVVMIPRQQLTPGHSYTVSIGAQGNTYTWSFSVASKK